MNCDHSTLAQQDGFGSVLLCSLGFVNVRVGLTTLSLTEAQFHRLVAMLTDSAANFELLRGNLAEATSANPDTEASGDLLDGLPGPP